MRISDWSSDVCSSDLQGLRHVKSQIAPHALSSVFELMLPDVEILSLDCFDTLVCRNTHSPADVFAELPELAPGLFRRQHAETYARSRARKSTRLNSRH